MFPDNGTTGSKIFALLPDRFYESGRQFAGPVDGPPRINFSAWRSLQVQTATDRPCRGQWHGAEAQRALLKPAHARELLRLPQSWLTPFRRGERELSRHARSNACVRVISSHSARRAFVHSSKFLTNDCAQLLIAKCRATQIVRPLDLLTPAGERRKGCGPAASRTRHLLPRAGKVAFASAKTG